MRLFIAEKPSVAAAIAAELNKDARKFQHFYDCGDGDQVTWCFGHLLQTAPPESYDPAHKKWDIELLPCLPTKWKLLPGIGKEEHLNEVCDMARRASCIVHAGDPDREGQLVVDEVLEYAGVKGKVQRLWLNAVDPASVKKALKNIEDNKKYQTFMHSALGRQRADWLIGLNITRLYTCLWQKRGGQGLVLTVGRVQTPTLALMVARDKEIANFKPHDYFNLTGSIEDSAQNTLSVRWQKERNKELPVGWIDADGRIVNKPYLDQIAAALEGTNGVCESVVREEKHEAPPLPFSLSELQKAADKLYGYSPKQVLDTCQSLYETHKLTTYPRTDCGYLKESQFDESLSVVGAIQTNLSESFVQTEGFDLSIKSAAWNDKKVTAHHGIIPTAFKVDMTKLSARELDIYRMIAMRYLVQFLPSFEYLASKFVFLFGAHEFSGNVRVITAMGWRVLLGMDSDDEEGANTFSIEQGDSATIRALTVKKATTKPPSRFTAALLIDAMKNVHRFVSDERIKKRLKENAGIGTEATRADIIEGLVGRNYVETRKNGKKVEYHSTVLGQMLIEIVPPMFASAGLTAFLEGKLSEVEAGTLPLAEVETVMQRIVMAAVDDGREGIGLEKMQPDLLPAHFKEAIEKEKAKRKSSREKGAPAKKGGGKSAYPRKKTTS